MNLPDAVEEIMSWFDEARPMYGFCANNFVSMTHFEGMTPYTKNFLEAAKSAGCNSTDGFIGDVKLADLGEPVDFAWLSHSADREELIDAPPGATLAELLALSREQCPTVDDNLACCALMRIRQVPQREVRGRARYARVVYEASMACIYKTGRYMTARSYLGEQSDGRVLDLCSKNRPIKEVAEDRIYVALAKEQQFARRYEWTVRLAYGSAPSISLVTNPTGALEVFRLRDIPPGHRRRAALRHWVSEHWRSRGTEDAVKVRAHLRGEHKFNWNGLRCEICPSAFDVERAEQPRRAI
jgi:hypothetical protein